MLNCGHILCRVDDIHSLVRDYRNLGFEIEWGATPRRAHNALVWFEDGPFLEFSELTVSSRWLRWPVGLVFGAAASDRLGHWGRPGEGWRDLAVETDSTSLAATRVDLRAAGLGTSRVLKGRRTRPDGQVVRFEFLATRPAGLPFVVSAYDPPQRPAQITHPNGARRVGRVRLGVTATDRPAVDVLVGRDPRVDVVPAARTGVIGVELVGLIGDLDRTRLHGAVLTTSDAEETQA